MTHTLLVILCTSFNTIVLINITTALINGILKSLSILILDMMLSQKTHCYIKY